MRPSASTQGGRDAVSSVSHLQRCRQIGNRGAVALEAEADGGPGAIPAAFGRALENRGEPFSHARLALLVEVGQKTQGEDRALARLPAVRDDGALVVDALARQDLVAERREIRRAGLAQRDQSGAVKVLVFSGIIEDRAQGGGDLLRRCGTKGRGATDERTAVVGPPEDPGLEGVFLRRDRRAPEPRHLWIARGITAVRRRRRRRFRIRRFP
ncbi:MAG: hypothetical protein O7E54_12760 [Planctomycetota bacterium]|nr:hypothetical protein [Planctomycetota bacterium]